jgi:hypothetical protein
MVIWYALENLKASHNPWAIETWEWARAKQIISVANFKIKDTIKCYWVTSVHLDYDYT